MELHREITLHPLAILRDDHTHVIEVDKHLYPSVTTYAFTALLGNILDPNATEIAEIRALPAHRAQREFDAYIDAHEKRVIIYTLDSCIQAKYEQISSFRFSIENLKFYKPLPFPKSFLTYFYAGRINKKIYDVLTQNKLWERNKRDRLNIIYQVMTRQVIYKEPLSIFMDMSLEEVEERLGRSYGLGPIDTSDTHDFRDVKEVIQTANFTFGRLARKKTLDAKMRAVAQHLINSVKQKAPKKYSPYSVNPDDIKGKAWRAYRMKKIQVSEEIEKMYVVDDDIINAQMPIREIVDDSPAVYVDQRTLDSSRQEQFNVFNMTFDSIEQAVLYNLSAVLLKIAPEQYTFDEYLYKKKLIFNEMLNRFRMKANMVKLLRNRACDVLFATSNTSLKISPMCRDIRPMIQPSQVVIKRIDLDMINQDDFLKAFCCKKIIGFSEMLRYYKKFHYIHSKDHIMGDKMIKTFFEKVLLFDYASVEERFDIPKWAIHAFETSGISIKKKARLSSISEKSACQIVMTIVDLLKTALSLCPKPYLQTFKSMLVFAEMMLWESEGRLKHPLRETPQPVRASAVVELCLRLKATRENRTTFTEQDIRIAGGILGSKARIVASMIDVYNNLESAFTHNEPEPILKNIELEGYFPDDEDLSDLSSDEEYDPDESSSDEEPMQEDVGISIEEIERGIEEIKVEDDIEYEEQMVIDEITDGTDLRTMLLELNENHSLEKAVRLIILEKANRYRVNFFGRM